MMTIELVIKSLLFMNALTCLETWKTFFTCLHQECLNSYKWLVCFKIYQLCLSSSALLGWGHMKPFCKISKKNSWPLNSCNVVTNSTISAISIFLTPSVLQPLFVAPFPPQSQAVCIAKCYCVIFLGGTVDMINDPRTMKLCLTGFARPPLQMAPLFSYKRRYKKKKPNILSWVFLLRTARESQKLLFFSLSTSMK